jgi:tetratricopeptide (TPR) repeat protein
VIAATYHADQEFLPRISEFRIDLHNTGVRAAKNVVRRRIEECFRFGIKVLKVVYGTPDEFGRSIAKEVHRIVRGDESVALERLPGYVRYDTEPEKLNPELRVYLRTNPAPQTVTDDTSFQPFTPKDENDFAKRLRCSTPYMPLRHSFSIEWAARVLKHGCTSDQLLKFAKAPRIAKLLDESGDLTWDAFCLLATDFYHNREKPKNIKKAKNTKKGEKRAALFEPGASPQPTKEPVGEVQAPFSEDPLQVASRRLRDAKTLALESRYEDAEKLLIPLATSADIPSEIVEEALLELGGVYLALNRGESETYLKQAVERIVKRLGRGKHLLPALEALGDFYRSIGDYDSLIKLSDDNADLFDELELEQLLPKILDHANVMFSAGRFQESLRALQDFSNQKRDMSISGSMDAYRYLLLGMNYSELNELFLADLAYKYALQCCEADRAECSELMPQLLMSRGVLQRRTGHYSDALKTYEETVKLLRSQGQSQSTRYADVMSSMGVSYRQTGDLENADRCYAEVVAYYKTEGRIETPEFAKVLMNVGVLRMEQKRYDESEKLLNEAYDLYELKSSENIGALVTIRTHLGVLYLHKGDLELSQVVLEEAVELAQRRLESGSKQLADAKSALADCLHLQGEPAKAAVLYAEALEGFERSDAMNSPIARQTQAKLKLLLRAIGNKGSNVTPPSTRSGESASTHSASEDPVTENPRIETLIAAAKEFASTPRTGKLGKAFALAVAGKIHDSVDEFEDAEVGAAFNAKTYYDYAMIMFIHGYASRAEGYAMQALRADPKLKLPTEFSAVLRELPGLCDLQTGNIRSEVSDRLWSLRNQYLRSKGF